MTIILDAMGSDTYPDPEVQAAVDAALLFGEEVILVGNEEILKPKLEAVNTQKAQVTIAHAPDVLEMTDKPVEGARKKPRNSMAVGMELVKSGRGQAFVTAGNTGGANFNALRTLGRIKGVQRPGLTTLLPTRNGRCLLLDIGANADCRPEFLGQFALMGSVYAQKVLKIDHPRIGLLSIGEEAGKGNQLVKESQHILEDLKISNGINFTGNVEPKEVYAGTVDVVVADGFTGNILVKTSEAVAKLLLDKIRIEIYSSTITKIGGALAKPAFKRVGKMMDPDEIGGAILLGIDGLVFVGHGRSNARALVSAMRLAREVANSGLITDLRRSIEQSLSKVEAPLASPSPSST